MTPIQHPLRLTRGVSKLVWLQETIITSGFKKAPVSLRNGPGTTAPTTTKASGFCGSNLPNNSENLCAQPQTYPDLNEPRPLGSRSYWQRVAFRELRLVPVRVGTRNLTRGIKPGHLIRRKIPASGSKVLLQLLLIARADNHSRNGRPLQQPVQRYLRNALAGFLRDHVDRINHLVQVF